jgi:hypothetical protein
MRGTERWVDEEMMRGMELGIQMMEMLTVLTMYG